jgi:hypothetical protein
MELLIAMAASASADVILHFGGQNQTHHEPGIKN